jgi:hypothetical protein
MPELKNLLKHIEDLNKFLISDRAPRFVGGAEWVDVSGMDEIRGQFALGNTENEFLKN